MSTHSSDPEAAISGLRSGPPTCIQVFLSAEDSSGQRTYMSPEVVAQLIGVIEQIQPDRLLLLGDSLAPHPLRDDVVRTTERFGVRVSVDVPESRGTSLSARISCPDTICIDVDGYVYDCVAGLQQAQPLGGGEAIHLSMLPDVQFNDMEIAFCARCSLSVKPS